MKLAVLMDPIASVNYKKDSTLAMLWAAAKRGHELWYLEATDLSLQQGQTQARMAPLTVFENPEKWFELGEFVTQPLATMDALLMRKDPPFDMNFIYATYLLERAEQAGLLVVNKPQSLRDCNEKLFATAFADCMVPTLVTSRAVDIRQFIAEHQDVIVKPLDGMGGTGIFRLQAGGNNIGATLEVLTDNGSRPIMAQRYIPEIKDGDKRVLMIDGEPVPYVLARIPQGDEIRGNLAAGGRGEARPINEAEKRIAARVGPELKKRGLLFVGLDVIGEYLTEVNVTSPTCIREIDAAFNYGIADKLIAAIEQKLALARCGI
ncbi:MAG: glutathione synthase [Moraxellaceae bacterium]|nr:glutathione synthase [Moraxellaceae bacterium]MDZ4386372.1 glutathione synthase [Moraxellaceae bacterium]